jgi:hypothetical protein
MASEREAFRQAKKRCTNPRDKDWKNYGGRGVQFRFGSFAEFFAEIGPRPEGLELDRISNSGHYEHGGTTNMVMFAGQLMGSR